MLISQQLRVCELEASLGCKVARPRNEIKSKFLIYLATFWVQHQLHETVSNTDYRKWLCMPRIAVYATAFKTSLCYYTLNHLKLFPFRLIFNTL